MSGFSQLSTKLVPTGEHGSELLLDAQAHIWNHILNFINSMSLKCAIELGIPDIIHNHGKPMTLSELTAALPIHPTKASSIYRLMRILSHSDFFALRKISENIEQEDLEGYVLTDASRLLLKDNPFSLRPLILSALDPNVTKPWHYLTTWFQNNDPTPFETAHGMRFWDYGKQGREVSHFFNDAMANDARLMMSMVIDKCKGTTVFEGLESVVDVGGGTGTAAKAIADAFPDMKVTVLDLPHVVVDLQGSKNLIYHGGDMFEAIPPADGVLLKWILHDWNDEECVKILKRCKEAITSNGRKGKVIIIDMVIQNQNEDDEKSIETQLLFDLQMMALVTGRERNEKELANLFLEAGFKDYKISPTLGLRSLIEVYPC